ncbi:MAG: hypothetical protein Q4B60_01195 [Erysipelotrichaceae bacterium]|nr:hypothetical protein [Erysipelotrichaceae bacterium]
MKKYIYTVILLILTILLIDYAYYQKGIYIDINKNSEAEYFAKTFNDQILIKEGNSFETMTIKGVNLGSGIPGEFSTQYAVKRE